ncbi:MAG: hypothetical protein WAX62_09850, partial [Trichococcus flocculiformis]
AGCPITTKNRTTGAQATWRLSNNREETDNLQATHKQSTRKYNRLYFKKESIEDYCQKLS